MKTGIELIAQERQEQLEKHGYTIHRDVMEHRDKQLAKAAQCVLNGYDEPWESPKTWPWDIKFWRKINGKEDIGKLAVAGALVAAEIDRLKGLWRDNS